MNTNGDTTTEGKLKLLQTDHDKDKVYADVFSAWASLKKHNFEEKKKYDDLIAKREVQVHYFPCNSEFHSEQEVVDSQKKFDWKVVEPFDGKKWTSWRSFGLKVSNPKYDVEWRDCTPLSLAWAGLVRLRPGQVEPLHTHTTPMFYFILQGTPIITLNNIKNRTSKWQCVNIPSLCPHKVYNDSKDEDAIFVFNYLPLEESAKPRPDRNFNWKFAEDVEETKTDEVTTESTNLENKASRSL